MGWFTGRDTGTKARNDSRGKVRKCGRCNRPLTALGRCPVCSATVAAHSTKVKVESHACTDGRVRVHRNGICAGPC